MSTAVAREFHLGDILSITTGRLVSPRHIYGVYDILNWMTGENLMTHQLPRTGRECKGPLLAQHPDLAEITVPDELDSEAKVLEWLGTITSRYGETLPVTPLAAEDHTRIDPITELRAMRPDAQCAPERPWPPMGISGHEGGAARLVQCQRPGGAAQEANAVSDVQAPARKWRVRDRDTGKSQTYGSESKAYDAVNAIAAEGHSAMVTHWEDGRWRLFEIVKPSRVS